MYFCSGASAWGIWHEVLKLSHYNAPKIQHLLTILVSSLRTLNSCFIKACDIACNWTMLKLQHVEGIYIRQRSMTVIHYWLIIIHSTSLKVSEFPPLLNIFIRLNPHLYDIFEMIVDCDDFNGVPNSVTGEIVYYNDWVNCYVLLFQQSKWYSLISIGIQECRRRFIYIINTQPTETTIKYKSFYTYCQ